MISVALVCEGNTDARVIPKLVERVFPNSSWADESSPGIVLDWISAINGGSYFSWNRDIKSTAQQLRIVVGARDFASKKVTGIALETKKALLIFQKRFELKNKDKQPQIVILHRDQDGDVNRLNEVRAAIDSQKWSFHVLYAVPIPMIESWVLCGFVPDATEVKVHQEIRNRLGFDPVTNSQRLSAKHSDHTKRCKTIHSELTVLRLSDESCYRETAIKTLMQNGHSNGLKEFIEQTIQILAQSYAELI